MSSPSLLGRYREHSQSNKQNIQLSLGRVVAGATMQAKQSVGKPMGLSTVTLETILCAKDYLRVVHLPLLGNVILEYTSHLTRVIIST